MTLFTFFDLFLEVLSVSFKLWSITSLKLLDFETLNFQVVLELTFLIVWTRATQDIVLHSWEACTRLANCVLSNVGAHSSACRIWVHWKSTTWLTLSDAMPWITANRVSVTHNPRLLATFSGLLFLLLAFGLLLLDQSWLIEASSIFITASFFAVVLFIWFVLKIVFCTLEVSMTTGDLEIFLNISSRSRRMRANTLWVVEHVEHLVLIVLAVVAGIRTL